MRWNPDNVITALHSCHMRIEHHKGVDENNLPREYRALMIARLGFEKFDEMELHARALVKREDAIEEAKALLGIKE